MLNIVERRDIVVFEYLGSVLVEYLGWGAMLLNILEGRALLLNIWGALLLNIG